MSLTSRTALSESASAKLRAVLNGLGYQHTRMCPEAIVAAAEEAQWSSGSWPFAQAVEWCRSNTVNSAGQYQVVSFALPKIWREAPAPEFARALARPLLEGVKQRHGPVGLMTLIDCIDRIFNVDVLSADDCKALAKEVLAESPHPSLILPGDARHRI